VVLLSIRIVVVWKFREQTDGHPAGVALDAKLTDIQEAEARRMANAEAKAVAFLCSSLEVWHVPSIIPPQ
jgi:hypothetical protein